MRAVGAGTVLALNRIEGRPDRDAVWETTHQLERGDAYTALIYDPEPSEAEMRAAGTDYPAAARRYASFAVSGGGRLAFDQCPLLEFHGSGSDQRASQRHTV